MMGERRATPVSERQPPTPWGSLFFRLVGERSEVFEQLPPALHHALARLPAVNLAQEDAPAEPTAALIGFPSSAFRAPNP